MLMQKPKNKRVRLHGKELAKLVTEVSERDGYHCVVCGAWVEPGTKPHHEPQGAMKSDELDKMAILCLHCHYERYFGEHSQEIRQKVREYLERVSNE